MKTTGKFGHLLRVNDIIFFMLYVAFILICNVFLVPDADLAIRFLASLLLTVSVYPLWMFNRKPNKESLIIIVISAIYGIYFSIPLLMPFEFYLPFRNITHDARLQALELSLLGLLVMLAAFYKYPKRLFQSWCPRLPSANLNKPYTDSVAVAAGIIGLISTAASIFTNVSSSIQQFLLLSCQLSLFAMSVLFFRHLNGKLSFIYIACLWFFLIPIQIALDLSTGLLFFLLRDASVVLMTYMLVRKRVPWPTLLASSMFFMLLLMSKGEFRQQTWNTDTSGSTSITAKIGIYADLIAKSTVNYDPKVVSKSLEGIVNRIDFHSILAYVISVTPSDVPYWGGDTYVPLLSRFIPRAVWPDKPVEDVGQRFGHRYGLLSSDDLTTSLNTPQIIELYMNFGPLGLIFGMALIGYAYRLISLVVNHKKSNEWNSIVGIVVYSSLLGVDSNFSLSFGNVIPSLIFYYFIGRLMFRDPTTSNASDRSVPVRTVLHSQP